MTFDPTPEQPVSRARREPEWSVNVPLVAEALDSYYYAATDPTGLRIPYLGDNHGSEDLVISVVDVVGETGAPGQQAVTLANRPEGSLTRATPHADRTWTVETWLTSKAPADIDTADLALAVIVTTAAPQYTDTIGPALSDEMVFGGDGPTQVAALIAKLSEIHIEERDRDKFTQVAPGATLVSYGGAAPYQARILWLGYDLYFRYRGGQSSLRVALPVDGTEPGASLGIPLWEARLTYGDSFGGYLDFDEFLTLLSRLIPPLEPAAKKYTFLPITEAGEAVPLYAMAHSVEDAHEWLEQHIAQPWFNRADYAAEPVVEGEYDLPEIPDFPIQPL